MRGDPIGLPALRYPRQGAIAFAGRVLRAVLLALARAMLIAFRVLLVVLLRVLRPFITWPLVLGCVGGMVATLIFAASHLWVDAARAGVATFACALTLGMYSMLAQTIDPEHFNQMPRR